MTAPAEPTAVEALAAGIVDYAGLFPPADLDMATAVRNYALYHLDSYRRLLGRFVVPAARLDEFVAAAEPVVPRRQTDDAWRLSALLGSDVAADAEQVAAFNAMAATRSPAGRVVIDAVEVRAPDADAIADIVAALPASVERFVEIPISSELGPVLGTLAHHRARAKVRTGGVTPDAIPSSAELARFLCAAHAARVPFKATAGLHHAIRGTHALTYEPDAPRAPMHGFINLFLAAALAGTAATDVDVQATLDEDDPDAFQFDGQGVRWHRQHIATDRLRQVRERFARSFGSCSFREPVDDLRAMRLL